MRQRIKNKKKGFTLVELIVVLIIMSIIAAIAVPFFINYWRSAEFRKNESNARTIYLAAESKLTYYRSSGQWEEFKKQVISQGDKADFFKDDASTADFNEAELNGRIYAITLDSESTESEQKKNLVAKLLGDYISEGEFLQGSIGIEIDIETGEVYSAFYGTKCKGLNYAVNDTNGYLTMQKRDYDGRKKRLLGYYSTEDVTNVVKLKPTRLRITSINLQNSEKLSLNWSSNVGQAQDVSYEVSFYDKKAGDGEAPLFTMTVSPYDLSTEGWSSSENSSQNLASIELKDKNGKSKGKWSFPLTYSDNKYSLVLDAMMSAKAQKAISDMEPSQQLALERTSSTNICRLKEVAGSLKNPEDIYAKVVATPYSGDKTKVGRKEYKKSEVAKSNSANTMYADNTSGTDIKISTFRHLSNIRYYNEDKNTTFTLVNKNMEWTAVGTGLYDLQQTIRAGIDQGYLSLVWKSNSVSDSLDFPEIEKLSEKYTLKGNGAQTLISELSFGQDSITGGVKYLGLFGEIEGKVEDVTFRNATLQFDANEAVKNDKDYDSVQAAGILAGRCQGDLKNVEIQSVKSSNSGKQAGTKVDVTLNNQNCSAVGGVLGVVATEGENNSYQKLKGHKLNKVTFDGEIKALLPEKTYADEGVNAGIGGIVGLAKLENDDETGIEHCSNHASLSGNYFTGGIVGRLDGSFDGSSESKYDSITNIGNSSNDGLILCTADAEETVLSGKYFGGIVGYGDKVLINNSYSASGRALGFTFDESKKDQLKGKYVGGIIGYGVSSLVNNCSTQKDGYVLGSDQVGGIAGALTGNVSQAIKADGSIKVTTNASYVIGNNYVGGIVGENAKDVTLKDCINNGVAAGYGRYVGGIVGYNNKGATIADCASYLSDYDNSVFRMITKTWNATADYAGGIAGYNNGSITFDDNTQSIMVKSVSSIVVGNNYVGGVAGFNDISGSLDIHYTLIGGRVYGYGDCVGGGFGFNASVDLLTKELTIKPRSVEGRYYVGGCIGANVVNLKSDCVMDRFRSDNVLGSITGRAFCGGVIGYQRTYGDGQLEETNGTVVNAVETFRTSAGTKLLPDIGSNNVPQDAFKSANVNKLIIKTNGNSGSSLRVATNNVPIQAGIYAGGIIGYCERGSQLVVKNCLNKGNLSNASGNIVVAMNDYILKEVSADFSNTNANPSLHLVGGIISTNLENQVIDHCSNSGSMSGYSGTGGVVGLNAGLVVNCSLTEHFGNSSLDYLGGIAGINVGEAVTTSKNYGSLSYAAGTIQNCSTVSGKVISGRNSIGGIVGWNLQNGILNQNTVAAGITASGDAVGGIAGRNSGTIQVAGYKSSGTATQRIYSNGTAVGGLVGINEKEGSIIAGTSSKGTDTELIAVGQNVSIIGREKVGGIVGINRGQLGSNGSSDLTCKASQVRASQGTVGGIVGETTGNITHAVNRSDAVMADSGIAGGITASNSAGKIISDCVNYGTVRSSDGYAGGITATNAGTIQNCTVKGAGTSDVLIYSLGEEEHGAVTAVNEAGALIENSKAEANVILEGDGIEYGGIAGKNEGTIRKTELTSMPAVKSTRTSLTVGGAVGENLGNVTGITTSNLNFENFTGYQYLGGIVGVNGLKGNGNNAIVKDSVYSGTMTEQTSKAGNCYGGIAGINYATLDGDKVDKITMSIKGIYTATSTSTESQKETSATHAGGITGKNEEDALITNCILKDNSQSSLKAENGMLGGITGFNKGTIQMSGSDKTSSIFSADVVATDTTFENLEKLDEKVSQQLDTDSNPVSTGSTTQVANMKYQNTNKEVSNGRLGMSIETNGNLGGITAYNGTTGEMTGCVSGEWFLVNKSQAIGVGTGGVIGMNSSEKNLNGLINGAFVGRQLQNGVTNRFAGGIIGNQNNSSSSGWMINNCINYGTVYCYNTHYSGGIMGQWTGSGGTIQNCRNYGNLQTTFQEGWIGASGGIVAQLYHAYEDNEYNIISCGNFGNLYTKDGATQDSAGANDSAGILGNVTTYRVNNLNDGQKYKIQILDCVNGPGVEIYSYSMASGVLGFLSTDLAGIKEEKKAEAIKTSTQNVEVRIERCQNYARILKGQQFVGGIFGDRYGEVGCKKTTVTDCYSINREDKYYNHIDYPIYSYKNTAGKASYMEPSNRVNNYFCQSVWQWNGWKLDKLDLDDNNAEIGSSKPEISVTNDLGENGYGADDKSQYAQYEYLMRDKTKNRYLIATVYPGHTVNSNYATILNSGYIAPKDKLNNLSGDVLDGKVLFYLDESYNTDGYYKVWDKMMAKGSNYYKLARQGYRNTEGIENNKILAPTSANATIGNGKISVEITQQGLPNALKGEKCNPFKYNIKISDGTTEETRVLYTEKGTFDIPETLSGNLTVQVQSVSMFSDVTPSDWITATTKQVKEVLPVPDVKVELVRTGNNSGNTENNYTYRFTLNNKEAYESYKGWNVNVAIQGGSSVTLDADHMSVNMTVDAGVYQMTAQAISQNKAYENSTTKSTPVYLPKYKPSIALKGNSTTVKATPSVSISGNTLDTLSIDIKLDGTYTGIIETPPVYRAELVGTWNGKDNVVFAQTDMLTVSNGVTTASFTNLPDYISQVNNLKVRIWYSQAGLGPVYTYYDVANESDANIKILDSVTNGVENWKYQFSPVLESYAGYFNDYNYVSEKLVTWLAKPVFDQADGSRLTPDLSSGNLKYTFSWDKKVGATEDPKYQISLTGIDASGKEVTIDTSDYSGGKSYTINGDDWNYTQVHLKVTRIGDANSRKIGLSSEATYDVAQRLEQPGQPMVTNVDENELNYQIMWNGIISEEGCAGYQAYIRTYDESGELGTAKELGTMVPAGQKANDGSYQELVNLEDYAGKHAVIYLVAKATTTGEDAGKYIDSIAGVTYELQIPERIPAPNVTWKTNWSYSKDVPFEADVFTNKGLQVSLTADEGSIPPGGSAYLLKAYIYNTKEEAEAATISNPGKAISQYPDGNVPVQMDVTDSTHYYHDLENFSIHYAGKWIVFYTRISSGGGSVSSQWAKTPQAYQLPYVKLAKPSITSDSIDTTITARVVVNPDIEEGEEQQWGVKRTELTWDSIECADVMTMHLAGKVAEDGTTEKKAEEADIRILEDQENHTVKVQQYVQEKEYIKDKDGKDTDKFNLVWVWKNVEETVQENQKDWPDDQKTQLFQLTQYQVKIASAFNNKPTYITLTAELEAIPKSEGGFTYKLRLPDVTSVMNLEGQEVTHDNFAITESVDVIANVEENLDGSTSDRYVVSEPAEVKWNK